MFNVDVRKEAQENLEYEVDKYNESVKKAKNVAKKLYDSRVAYHERLSLAIDYINSLKKHLKILALILTKQLINITNLLMYEKLFQVVALRIIAIY